MLFLRHKYASLFSEKFPIPHKGAGYSIVLIIGGGIIIALGFINQLLMGPERFFLVIEGALVIIAGMLGFVPKFLAFLPREGILFAGMVMLVGAAGLLYGLLGMS